MACHSYTTSAKSLTEVSPTILLLEGTIFIFILKDLYFGNIYLAAPDLIGINDHQGLKYISPPKQGPITKLIKGLSNSSIPKYTVGDACFNIDGPIKLINFRGS
jgi:hypothetical protein